MKTCLIVLGMHRSGTSALTGALDLLGVHLGSQMLETQADNPKGFFENKYVVQANDCILDTLKTTWDDTLPLPPDWLEHFEGSQIHIDIDNFLDREMAEGQLSALKDPRLCRLLPLWLPHFDAQGVTAHFALVVRNPLEIAESLRQRNGFSREKSLVLWMQHMLAAERHSRGRPRGFIDFDTLVADPQAAVTRLLESAGLELPPRESDHSASLVEFLDANMRHHTVAEAELDANCPEPVAACYRLLRDIAQRGEAGKDALQALDEIGDRFEALSSLLYHEGVLAFRERLGQRAGPDWRRDELARLKDEYERDKNFRERRYSAHTNAIVRDRDRLQAHADRLEREIGQFIGSPPWRVYRKYQEIVEAMMPQGSFPRRLLQQVKSRLSANQSANSETGGQAPEPAAESETASPTQQAPAEQEAPTWEPLEFPAPATPQVSIIIPVFNNWQFTWQCLRSVHEHTTGSYELIVVDNHSTDETPELLAAMQGIRVITNDANEVFVNACNQAAAQARGEYLLLLNNDTEVTPGWLEAMLAPFSDSSTGLVGAKLIYPDGRLQEAGGIVWRDATGCNYGHGEDPSLPQFNYRREVDYCSGACLMISRVLWRELDGFDTRYAPAYYEDTDLCFAVRALHYQVVYQPAAVVIHYGGASAGKDTSSGYKRFQEINRHKFLEKWREVLETQHVSSAAGTRVARERRGDRHILIIDHYVPTFDRDSGSQRMLSMLQILRDMGWKVSFWPDDLTYDERYTRVLQDMGVETYYGTLDFEDVIATIGDDLDAVLMSRPATAQDYVATVKKYSDAQTIFDTVDLHFVREQRRLEREVQQWKNLEFYLAEETDTTLVVSPTEKELLSTESFADKVAVVSNIHRLEPCVKGFEERSGLMFIGGFAHPPNEEGIVWFIEFVLPLIREKLPDIHLTIVGSDPTERLLALAGDAVVVAGYVEDVQPVFENARVFVSPLLHGAGVKGKIGQSFSYGLPVVTTSIGAEGMSLGDGHNALIADSESAFAEKVIALHSDRSLWQKLSTNGRQVIREQFSFDTIRAALERILDDGPGRRPGPQPRPVLLHCHLFKNAGSSLDWSLARHFGERFVDHRDDDAMRRGADYLGPYIARHQTVSALSSHHVRFPLPQSDDFQILPVIALRHPIDRARSVYDFERRQQASTPGAIKAKELDFTDYIRWRMRPDSAPTVRNFHCAFLTSRFDSDIDEHAYLDSLGRLAATPFLVLVEYYDESMVLLEHNLAPYFPDIDLAYIAQNVTTGRDDNTERRVQAVYEELGPELEVLLREKNHWDMQLYENALGLFRERLGGIGRFDEKLANFRARCRVLDNSAGG
ncbi:MAG: glycosyltransferase [Halioglobus sp.]|nr:glycosyltransferase [Halioglobus sp.]